MSMKEFDQSKDISSQLSSINEIIPLTGTLFSGAANFYTKYYQNITSGSSVSGGFFQTVFDGAPTSISASNLVDLTFGISSASFLYGRSETFLKAQKNRIYREMANLLLGSESNLFTFNNITYNELIFLLMKRRIFKDEIKKGNTDVNLQVSGSTSVLSLVDTNAQNSFTVGPAGDQAPLYSGSVQVGQVYYNAGIIAFTTGVFIPDGNTCNVYWSGSLIDMDRVAISGSIDSFLYGLRQRINNIQFFNQTNLHSTIYFARALNSEFNYSTNPTFVDSTGRIIPTSGSSNTTRTYITTVGLYDINNRLMAVAKTSVPVKKSPDSELIFKVRLSY